MVGNYDYVQGTTKSNVRVRVYVPLGKKDQGKYALDTAVAALDFYEKYYNVSNLLWPLDQCVVDAAAGLLYFSKS